MLIYWFICIDLFHYKIWISVGMAEWLRTLVALIEDPTLFSVPRWQLKLFVTLITGSSALFQPIQAFMLCTHTHTHMCIYNIYVYIPTHIHYNSIQCITLYKHMYKINIYVYVYIYVIFYMNILILVKSGLNKNKQQARQWWLKPLISALVRQSDLGVRGQPGLQIEFQGSQRYREILSKKRKKEKKKKPNNNNKKTANTCTKIYKQVRLGGIYACYPST